MPRAIHADDKHPGVVSVTGVNHGDEAVRLADLLLRLKGQGFIRSYDEVAILLPSVRGRYSDLYFDALRYSNIPVHRDRTENAFSPIANSDGDTANAPPARRQPPGRVLLTTIHQAKGREWPVVCAAGLHGADLRPNEIDIQLGAHLPRPPAGPPSLSAELELTRQYYVAFSRAQRLLVLSAARRPHHIFRPVWGTAVPWEDADQSLLSGPGKFVAKDTRPSSATVDSARQIVVPASATLVLRTNFPGPPHLFFQVPRLGRPSPPTP